MNIKNVQKIATIFIIIGSTWLWQHAVYAEDIIDFDVFQKQAKQENISKMPKIQQLKYIRYINQKECFYAKEDTDMYIITPSCLFGNKLPQVPLTQALEIIWPHIEAFNTIYNESAQSFVYEWTNPILNKTYDILPKTIAEKIALAKAEKENKKIKISIYALAVESIKQANFYVVYRDISPLKRCTKQNYFVALNALNNKVIQPGETLNLNQEIANAQGYCKGSGRKDLMFYGGVCGASTQLFRASLLSPQVTISKRYGHSQRIVPYYSEYIFGDDAAMYEMSKQFEIKNQSNNELYIKHLEKNGGVYLAIITPQKDKKWVIINKFETQKLKATVEKNIYEREPKNIIDEQKFLSTYTQKEYNTR
jgi:hypothetical protein